MSECSVPRRTSLLNNTLTVPTVEQANTALDTTMRGQKYGGSLFWRGVDGGGGIRSDAGWQMDESSSSSSAAFLYSGTGLRPALHSSPVHPRWFAMSWME
jgi:hypothetical protein